MNHSRSLANASALVGEDQPAMAEFLIHSGADDHAANDLGMTPLSIAQQAAMVEILVGQGAKLDARSKQGWTPLHVQGPEGEDTGSVEVMEALLKADADPNLRDDADRTPLDYALLREEEEKVALLRSYGARENACEFSGRGLSQPTPYVTVDQADLAGLTRCHMPCPLDLFLPLAPALATPCHHRPSGWSPILHVHTGRAGRHHALASEPRHERSNRDMELEPR
jgi:ankyrin repeat protein